MEYKLIKKLKRPSGGYRVKGAMIDVNEAEAAKLMAAGYIADPNKPIIKTTKTKNNGSIKRNGLSDIS